MKKEIFDFYSYLRISGTQAAARRREAEKAGIHVPVFLQADISARCNLSCPGCENGCVRTKHQEELLELEQWDGLFREAEQLGVRVIFLTGGEPLMEREILERASRYQNCWFLVFTKGTLLNSKYNQFFSDHPNLVPMLCLDACSNINLVKGGKSSYLYENLMYAMDALSRRDIVYGTSVTLTSENRHRVLTRGFLDGLNRRKCNGVLYLIKDEAEENTAGTENLFWDGSLLLNEEEKEEVKRTLKELWEDYHDMVLYTLSRSGRFFGRPFEKSEVYRISADGNVFNCPAGLEKLGNLKEKNLRSILQKQTVPVDQ